MVKPADATMISLEAAVRTACILEATARKAGNVHPGASFHDLIFADFVASAHAISPVLARTEALGVGRAVLSAVEATRSRTPRNTNLGIILLIAPLAAVPRDVPLAQGIHDVLERLTVADAESVYAAIRLAQPGGMGEVRDQDVSQRPNGTLREVMQLATDRDLIARQYATGFRLVLETGVPYLAAYDDFETEWEQAIIGLQLSLLSEHPDSLIARKCGGELAAEASRRARVILAAGWPENAAARTQWGEFDAWLRADGNRRNPGTTADLVTASLFAALREGLIRLRDLGGVGSDGSEI